MNILILNWRDPKNPKSGGAEIVTLEHAKAWVKKDHNVVWFTSSFKGAKGVEIIDSITIIRKGSALSVILLAPFFYLFSGIQFDVVIDEIHGLPFFTPLYVRRPKIIAFIHEVAGEIWDYMYPFPVNLVGKFLEFFYFQFYKQIPFWTVSNSTKNDLEKMGISGQNIQVILNGVDTKINDHWEKEKDPTFIFVSRLVKMKGIENVVEAFRFIFQQEPTAKLWIVGGGEASYVEYLRSKTKDVKPSLKFWGRVTNEKKLELMGKAHLLLHASVKEGWGLVVLEAASQGTPAIVYKVAGLVDSVKDAQTGIIVKENSPKELAKEALKLIENNKKYKALQESGIDWVKSLTWEKATKESLNLLKG